MPRNKFWVKSIAFTLFVLIICMSSINITSKTVKKQVQTIELSIDDSVDWWPMYNHDCNHSGYSSSKGPVTNDLKWVYQTGAGSRDSSFAIFNYKVYVGDGDGFLHCLDSNTGELIWKTYTEGGIRSTPAVNEDKVYIGANSQGFYCLNATNGDVIWMYWLEEDSYPSSPVVSGGKVYFSVRTPNKSMVCLNADTGEEIWISIIGNILYSPAVFNGKIYTASHEKRQDSNYVYCLDASDGEIIWKFEGYIFSTSPSIYDEKIYIGCRGDDNFFDYFYCLNMKTGSLIWQYDVWGYLDPLMPCFADGKVFFGQEYGNLFCLDANTGDLIWEVKKVCPFIYSSTIYADGMIYFPFGDNNIYCFNASSGEIIWKFLVTTRTYASPAIADGKLYVSSGSGTIFCFGGISDNHPPITPVEILGPTEGYLGVEYTYNTSTYDPDGDQLYYRWEWAWGDTGWIGPYNSNETVEVNCKWYNYEGYSIIYVITKDTNHARSDWATLDVYMQRNKATTSSLFLRFFEHYPMLGRLLYLIN